MVRSIGVLAQLTGQMVIRASIARADSAAFGHVNNKQALTHFESSRIVWMTELAQVRGEDARS